jgi:hypothetical protein
MSKSLYLIDDGERDWVVAESPEAAIAENASLHGYTPEEYVAEHSPTVTRIPDDELVKVYQDTPYRDPTPYITKTAAEWAAESDGVIATSVY